MAQVTCKTREEAFEQLNRLHGVWLEDDGSESTRYEWLGGGRNFMVQYLGGDGASGIEVIGYDDASGLLKSHFYASDSGMLDNGGKSITYVYSITDDTLEIALDGMPDRSGSFVAKLSDDDRIMDGRWDWVQDGEQMGYDAHIHKAV